jgi:NADH-quinone oxidoreductase subunit E
MSETSTLSHDAFSAIDKEIAKYPPERKSSAVMAALAIAQHELGWISKDVVESVAEYLDMRPIAVWEVATFYGMYNLDKPGRFKIAVCTNLPCALRGANEVASELQKLLGINYNETTSDGMFTLKEAECMGACGDAPVFIVNDREMKTRIETENLVELITELKSK